MGDTLDDMAYLQKLFRQSGDKIWETRVENQPATVRHADPPPLAAGSVFCTSCGDIRRMDLQALSLPAHFPWPLPEAPPVGPGDFQPVRPRVTEISPSVFRLTCRECGERALLVVVRRDGQDEAVVLPEVMGGLATPHSPDSVRYYLDEAHRARSVGAFSAALGMYRTALEHVLTDQGYDQRPLGKKIEAIEKEVEADTAPRWVTDLAPQQMEVFQQLGNATLHSNAGEVAAHRELDAALVVQMDALFLDILDAIYERPARTRNRIEEGLRRAAELKGGSG